MHLRALLFSLLAGGSLTAAEPVKVFVLAGQSNMQGQGIVDLDHPQHYNGGRGILERVMAEAESVALARALT